MAKAPKTLSKAEIKAKTEALQNAIYELSAAMYQKAAADQQAQQQAGQQGQSSGGQEPGGQSGQGPTVDADYEVVNDKK